MGKGNCTDIYCLIAGCYLRDESLPLDIPCDSFLSSTPHMVPVSTEQHQKKSMTETSVPPIGLQEALMSLVDKSFKGVYN